MLIQRLGAGARRLLGRVDPVILMYHRVASPAVDPWGMAVSPEHFAEQMRVLCAIRQPVSLPWLVAELAAGRAPARTVAVTFDDGYRDVLDNAVPVLNAFGVPATMYIATNLLGSERGAWWDRLASIAFGAAWPDVLPRLSFVDAPAHNALREAAARGDVASIHLGLWSAIRVLSEDGREAAIAEVAATLGTEPSRDAPIMCADDVGRLVANGFTIGAHSCSHPPLTSLTPDQQTAELVKSREYLERLTGARVDAFAYPFGDFDATTERLARDAGFGSAVSALGGTATSARQLWRLPRFDVKDWAGDEFRVRLEQYF